MNELVSALNELKELNGGMFGIVVSTDVLHKAICALEDKEVEVMIEERVFSLSPDTMYASVKCGECGELIYTRKYDVTAWEEYMRDHFKPELPNYCKHCGVIPVYKKGE